METIRIEKAFLIDGSGKPGEYLDLEIYGERISRIGKNLTGQADRVIDGSGKILAPGFIDIHTHTEDTIFRNPLSDSKILQGVTSEVICLCGMGPYPLPEGREVFYSDLLADHYQHPKEEASRWRFFGEYKKAIEAQPIATNILPLVPHGMLRTAALGMEDRAANPDEQKMMERWLERCMEEGAWGLSTGLEYPPGSFSDLKELVGLAKVVGKYQGMYASHLRNEDRDLLECIEELIAIGRQSGAHIQASHLKAVGPPHWGNGLKALEMLQNAKGEGLSVGIDQYPYASSSTFLSLLVPDWAHAGGVEAMLGRLQEKEDSLLAEIEERMNLRGGPEGIRVINSSMGVDGLNLREISEIWQIEPVFAVIRLIERERGLVRGVFSSMQEKEVERLLQSEDVGVGSDGAGLRLPEDGKSAWHPRNYATFSRVLAYYVRDRKCISLETAIAKMTGINAASLGLKNRGLLKEGWFADLILFDLEEIKENSSFADSNHYSSGMDFVVVNGKILVGGGVIQGTPNGRVLCKTQEA